MKRDRRFLLFCELVLLLGFVACVKVIERRPLAQTTLFVEKGIPKQKLWETIRTIIENDFQFTFKFADVKHGNFTTEFKTLDVAKQLRSQLFLTIRPSSDGSHVSIFQFLQRWDENAKIWKSISSDQELETRFIAKLEEKIRLEK